MLLQSKRSVVQVDANGEVASSGTNSREVEIPSIVVLEAPLSNPKPHWRIARIEEIGQRGPPKEDTPQSP